MDKPRDIYPDVIKERATDFDLPVDYGEKFDDFETDQVDIPWDDEAAEIMVKSVTGVDL